MTPFLIASVDIGELFEVLGGLGPPCYQKAFAILVARFSGLRLVFFS